MLIREFKPHDIKRVYEIEMESFQDPYELNILKQLYDIGTGFLVAQENNYIVGYIVFWIKELDEGHIISLAVDEKYQRSKVGSKLLSTAITVFKSFNVQLIKLEVRAKNKTAIKFYHNFGFKIDKHMPRYYEDGEDGLSMVFNL